MEIKRRHSPTRECNALNEEMLGDIRRCRENFRRRSGERKEEERT